MVEVRLGEKSGDDPTVVMRSVEKPEYVRTVQ